MDDVRSGGGALNFVPRVRTGRVSGGAQNGNSRRQRLNEGRHRGRKGTLRPVCRDSERAPRPARDTWVSADLRKPDRRLCRSASPRHWVVAAWWRYSPVGGGSRTGQPYEDLRWQKRRIATNPASNISSPPLSRVSKRKREFGGGSPCRVAPATYVPDLDISRAVLSGV